MSYFQVDFYETESGKCPVLVFLDRLEEKKRAKVLRMIEILEVNGNELREPYSKALEDGIFELRVKQGSDIVRILYFFIIGNKIILTHGFKKKSQKTPQAEILKAKKYRKDYLRRYNNE